MISAKDFSMVFSNHPAIRLAREWEWQWASIKAMYPDNPELYETIHKIYNSNNISLKEAFHFAIDGEVIQ